MAWLSDWAKRIRIKIDNGDIDSALTDFPILIYLSASSGINSDDISGVFDELTSNDNRKKIAITKSDGITQYYIEIERWDDINEQAYLHVKVPSINNSIDTYLYLYYDSSKSDNTTYVNDVGLNANVWDSDFKGVWHLSENLQSNPNWGINTIGDIDTTDDFSRSMGGTSPNIDDMIIKSISMYLGSQTGDVRLAVYTGGDLDDPSNATLLWDAGIVNPNGVAGWYKIDHPTGGIALTKNTVMWLAWKRDTGVRIYYYGSSQGDFQSGRGRNDNDFDRDPSVAFPSSYNDSGTFNDFWYSIYITFETIAIDSTSNNNDGINIESTNIDGKIGKAQDFNSDTSKINCGSNASIDNIFTDGGTIEVIFNADTFGENAYGRILSKGNDNEGWALFMFTSNSRLAFSHKTSGAKGTWQTPESSIAVSTDYHVAVSFNKNSIDNVPTIILNGVTQSLTEESDPTGTFNDDSSYDLIIGNFPDGSRCFDGYIDEIRSSNNIRLLAWLNASYESQKDHLLDFDSEELYSGYSEMNPIFLGCNF